MHGRQLQGSGSHMPRKISHAMSIRTAVAPIMLGRGGSNSSPKDVPCFLAGLYRLHSATATAVTLHRTRARSRGHSGTGTDDDASCVMTGVGAGNRDVADLDFTHSIKVQMLPLQSLLLMAVPP